MEVSPESRGAGQDDAPTLPWPNLIDQFIITQESGKSSYLILSSVVKIFSLKVTEL